MATPLPGVWGIDVGQCGVKAIRLQNRRRGIDRDRLRLHRISQDPHPARRRSRSADPRGARAVPVAQCHPRRHGRHCRAGPERSGPLRQAAARRGKEDRRHRPLRGQAADSVSARGSGLGLSRSSAPARSPTASPWAPRSACSPSSATWSSAICSTSRTSSVEVQIVQMAPLALCNFVAYDLITQAGRGAKRRSRQERSAWSPSTSAPTIPTWSSPTATASSGSGRFRWAATTSRAALTKDMKLTFAKAEHLKRNAIKSPDLQQDPVVAQDGAQRFRRRSAALARLLHQHPPRRQGAVHDRPGQRLPSARPAEVPAGKAAAGGAQVHQAGPRRGRGSDGGADVRGKPAELRRRLWPGPAGA